MKHNKKQTLPQHQVSILSCGLYFTPMPKLNIIQLKTDIHNYTSELLLTKFLQNTLENILRKMFLKQSLILHHPDMDLDHTTRIFNNLDLNPLLRNVVKWSGTL